MSEYSTRSCRSSDQPLLMLFRDEKTTGIPAERFPWHVRSPFCTGHPIAVQHDVSTGRAVLQFFPAAPSAACEGSEMRPDQLY
jgi:hypothetical protein